MNYFGFTLYFSNSTDRELVKSLYLTSLKRVRTLKTTHLENDYIQNTSFPFELMIEGLKRDRHNLIRVYIFLDRLKSKLSGKILVEYVHPRYPTDPYYSLLFTQKNISLVSDADWETTGDVLLIKQNYTIPFFQIKKFFIF